MTCTRCRFAQGKHTRPVNDNSVIPETGPQAPILGAPPPLAPRSKHQMAHSINEDQFGLAAFSPVPRPDCLMRGMLLENTDPL